MQRNTFLNKRLDIIKQFAYISLIDKLTNFTWINTVISHFVMVIINFEIVVIWQWATSYVEKACIVYTKQFKKTNHIHCRVQQGTRFAPLRGKKGISVALKKSIEKSIRTTMGRKNLRVTSGIVQPNTGTSCFWFLIRTTGLSDATTKQTVII